MANKQPTGSDHLAPVNSNSSQSSQMSENSLLNSSLVTNSQLDASVSPYIPQSASMSYNNQSYYNSSAPNVYHGMQYPPAMQPVYADTEDYSSDAGAMHETNTSVPPPAAVSAYDGNSYPMSYPAVQPTPQYYMPHGHQQVMQPPMYQQPQYYAAPYHMANPHQEYYSQEGPGAREEAPEGQDGSASCGGDRRRSSLSVSSCSSAAAVPPGPTSPGTMDGCAPTPPHQGEPQHHAAAVSAAAQYSLPPYHPSQKPLLHPPPSLAPPHQPTTLSSMQAKHPRHPATPYGGGAAAAAAAAATCMVHVQNSHVSLSLYPPNQAGMVPFNAGLVPHPNAASHLATGAYPSAVPSNLVNQLQMTHQQQQQLNTAGHLAYMNPGAMMDPQHSAAAASGYNRAQQQRHSYRNEDMNSNKQSYRGGASAGRGRGMSRGGVRGGANPGVNRARRSDSFTSNNDRNSFSGNDRNSFSGGDRMNPNDERGSYENNSFANNDHGERDYGQPMNYVQFHQVPYNQMSKKLEGHPLFVHNVPMVPTTDHMANYVPAYQPYLNQPPPGNDMPNMMPSHIPPPQTTQYSHNFNEQNMQSFNNVQNKETGHVEPTLESGNNGVVQEPLTADGNSNVLEAQTHVANSIEPSNGNANTYYSPVPPNANIAHESREDLAARNSAGQNMASAHSSPAPTPLQEQFSELSVSQHSLSPIPSTVLASDVQLSSGGAAVVSPVPEAVSPTCDVNMSGVTMGSPSLPSNEAVSVVPTVDVSSSPLPTAATPQSSVKAMSPVSLPTAVTASSTLLPKEDFSIMPNGDHELARQDANLGQQRIPIMDTHSGQVCNLPFEYRFGDISAEDLCMEINKISDADSTLKGLKNSEKKLDSTPSKSKKSPLFDTSLHGCDAIAVPFTTGDNARTAMPESPGFQFICTDVTSPTHTSLATSLVFTSRSLPKQTESIVKSSTISYPVAASNLPVQSEVGSSSSIKPASAAAKQRQTVASSRREPAPVAATCPPQVTPDHTPTSEKPPVPPKKGSSASEQASPPAAATPSVPATAPLSTAAVSTTVQQTAAAPPQQTAAIPPQAASAGGSSAWQKQKNWTEHLKGEKRIAVVSPFNGSVSGPGLPNDGGAELSSVSGGGSSLQGFAGVVSNGHLQPRAAEAAQLQLDAALLEGDRTKIGEFLLDYKPDYSSVTLQPRGLTNKNYWCYSNTVLQAVVCIPQFVNMYRKMDELLAGLITQHTMPVTHSIIAFLKEFAPMNFANINLNTRSRGKKGGQNIVNLPEIHLGDPFEPSSIHKMLLEKTGGQFMEGLQQDAEEMLTFLLNAGHDEFTECLKLANMKEASKSGKGAAVVAATNVVVLPNGQADDSNEAWVTMGPKNKSCITRTTQFSHSPISKIFWGESRSIIRKGNSPVTANLEPFITLQLDIQDEKITSVKDALDQFVSKADVAGYTCTDTREELTVSNQRLLEQLPEVLILQLKRFVYSKDGGLQKVVKDLTVPIDLEITKELISVNQRKKLCTDKNKYKLVSIVYHDGKEASKGHYVCDVFHYGYNCWLHYDDACVKPIASAELQRCNAPRVPYILFYRREDTFIDGVFPTAALPSNILNKRRNKDKRNSSVDTAESSDRNSVTDIKVSNSLQQPASAGAPEDKSSGAEAAVSVGNEAKSSVDRKNSLDRKGSKERKAPQNPPKNANKRQEMKKGGQAKKNVGAKNANSN